MRHIANPFSGISLCGRKDGEHTLSLLVDCPDCIARCPAYNQDVWRCMTNAALVMAVENEENSLLQELWLDVASCFEKEAEPPWGVLGIPKEQLDEFDRRIDIYRIPTRKIALAAHRAQTDVTRRH